MNLLRPAALATALLIAGCTTGPDYQRPVVDTPPAWRPAAPLAAASAPAASSPAAGAGRAAAIDAALAAAVLPPAGGKELLDTSWWSAFGDEQLDQLVRTAVEENQDLRIAALRIEQLDAFLQISKSAGGPQAGYNASRSRDTLSENRQQPLAVGTRPVDNAYSASAAASWELDLWGRLARADEAAFAELVAGEENRRALMQSIVSEVAAAYIRLLALDRELLLLKDTVASLRETLKLAESRFNAGGSSELPVLKAQADWQMRQGDIPAKEGEIAALENAISALLGRNPGPITRGRAAPDLVLPKVPAGLPADLLAQRPDVRKAEQDLVAANARIGVAKAQYYPSISLTTSSGFASNELGKLTQLTSNFGSFGVSLLGPLFTSGRIAGQVREAEAQQKQAAVTFVKSMQTALHEVEDALVGHAKGAQQVTHRTLQVQTLREQQTVAKKRFDLGIGSWFDVLEADRGLAASEQLLNDARRQQMTSLIAVYKAMGGGWQLPDVVASRPNPKKTSDE